jgi:hypothetical protein
VSIQVGESTPEFAVTAHPSGGVPHQVPARLESTDANVLAPDPAVPGRFIARSLGETPIRAEYRGREAFATVSVTGKRFLRVSGAKNDDTETAQDFDVTVTVLADESEGPLEYRVYAAGETPAENWTRAESAGGTLQATLRSGRIRRGLHGQQYHLILEARNPGEDSVQQYQYKFQLVSRVQEAENRPPPLDTDLPF